MVFVGVIKSILDDFFEKMKCKKGCVGVGGIGGIGGKFSLEVQSHHL